MEKIVAEHQKRTEWETNFTIPNPFLGILVGFDKRAIGNQLKNAPNYGKEQRKVGEWVRRILPQFWPPSQATALIQSIKGCGNFTATSSASVKADSKGKYKMTGNFAWLTHTHSVIPSHLFQNAHSILSSSPQWLLQSCHCTFYFHITSSKTVLLLWPFEIIIFIVPWILMIYSPLISTSLPAFSLFLRTFPALSIFLLTYSSTYSVTCWVCRTQNSWTASTSEGTRYTAGRWRRCHLLRIAWVLVRAVAPTMAHRHSLCALLQRPLWERNEWESNFRLVPHKEGYQYPWLILILHLVLCRFHGWENDSGLLTL